MIKGEALYQAARMTYDNFEASDEWLMAFKTRNNLDKAQELIILDSEEDEDDAIMLIEKSVQDPAISSNCVQSLDEDETEMLIEKVQETSSEDESESMVTDDDRSDDLWMEKSIKTPKLKRNRKRFKSLSFLEKFQIIEGRSYESISVLARRFHVSYYTISKVLKEADVIQKFEAKHANTIKPTRNPSESSVVQDSEDETETLEQSAENQDEDDDD